MKEKLASSESSDEAAEVKEIEQRLAKVQETLAVMTSRGLTQDEDPLTVTEPSARSLRQKDGSYAPGYNAQAVTDLETGVVIHVALTERGSDSGQLQPQVEAAEAVLRPLAEGRGVACFVPDDRSAHRTPPGVAPEYRASEFVHDEAADTMTCPQRHVLKRCGFNEDKTSARYPAKGRCCPKTQGGRQVNKTLYAETIQTAANRVQSEEGGWMRRARWVICEGVFARFGDLLHWKRCRMWGREGAEAELCWRWLGHNLMLLAGLWKPLVLERTAA